VFDNFDTETTLTFTSIHPSLSISFTALLYSWGVSDALFVAFVDNHLLKNTLVEHETEYIKKVCSVGVWAGLFVCLFVSGIKPCQLSPRITA